MKHSKLVNGSRREAGIRRKRSASEPDRIRSAGGIAVRKKTATLKAGRARLLQKRMDDESKLDRLVCRYCGSEDLAPSFIKRRDRRCRKCLSRRYGSAARTRKMTP